MALWLFGSSRISGESFLILEKVVDKKTGVVLVVEVGTADGNTYFLKTCFYRAANKIKKHIK